MAPAPTDAAPEGRRWGKSPPALIEAFLAALPQDPRVERRQMFGYPCAFVNGHMAVGLHENRLIARVPDQADRHPCVILGRCMKAYVAIEETQAMARGAMRRWVQLAIDHTATMAPKAAKTAAARKSTPVRKAMARKA
jgi:TfoX/Sxy family transcriptional regulator of competence genes